MEMRKPRRWRRNRLRWEDGGAGPPPSPLSGAGTLSRLMPPLLLLTLGGAAVALRFSRSPSFSGGGAPHFPPVPDFVVERTQVAVAAPFSSTASSSASTKREMRANNTTPLLCNWKEGHGDEERRRRRKRTNMWSSVEDDGGGPYHDWELLRADMEELMGTLKIYVYPDAQHASSAFAGVFLPQADPFNPRLGNYHSEHMFKHALLRSPLLSPHPRQAHLFFLPISINALRNHPRVRSEAAIADFVARYVDRQRRELPFWNASRGADHFYVSCHSIGRDAAARHRELRNNARHVSCSSSYFQRNYVAHKDVALPQVWPRPPEISLNPPGARKQLVFFAGRIQNSQVRAELILRWENDSSMDIFSRNPPFSYEEGFRRSRYCLHVKGYEVNTARISDAIHYGCIPVILSNYYDLPFANLLDWTKFSVIVNHRDIGSLKEILLSISNARLITETARQSQDGWSSGDWIEIEGAWVLKPKSTKPTSVIHFIGGSFVGAAPQLTYRLFLERLAEKGILVIATPFASGFDHFSIADQVQFKFDRCLRSLQDTANDLPTFGIGHSLGSVIHLLIGSRYAVQRQGNILMAFNNKEASLAIPLFSPVIVPMAQSLGPFLSQFTSSPAILRGAEMALKQLENLSPPIMRQVLPLVEQLPPLYMDLVKGREDFSPKPEETRRLIKSYYGVSRNLLIKFSDDTIDETPTLAQVLSSESAISSQLDMSIRSVPGDHGLPLQQVLPDVPPAMTEAVNRGGEFLTSLTVGTPWETVAKEVGNTLGADSSILRAQISQDVEALVDVITSWMASNSAP